MSHRIEEHGRSGTPDIPGTSHVDEGSGSFCTAGWAEAENAPSLDAPSLASVHLETGRDMLYIPESRFLHLEGMGLPDLSAFWICQSGLMKQTPARYTKPWTCCWTLARQSPQVSAAVTASQRASVPFASSSTGWLRGTLLVGHPLALRQLW